MNSIRFKINWHVMLFMKYNYLSRLVQRTDEENYIHIGKNRMGCSSKPGMRGGRQLIRAGDCQTFHLVHEIMHALGNVFLYLLDNLHH